MHPVQSVAVAVILAVVALAVVLAVVRRRRARRRPVRALSVTLTADTTGFTVAMRQLARRMDQVKASIATGLAPAFASLTDMAGGLVVAMDRMTKVMSGVPLWVLDPDARVVHVAGLESKMYVRAGLDPRYADPTMLDFLVAQIGHEKWLTPAEKAGIQAAAIAGWVEHRPGEPSPTFAWHQLVGNTAFEVGRARDALGLPRGLARVGV